MSVLNTSNFFENETIICGLTSDHVLLFVRTYYMPLIIIVGVIGNALSCVVFLATSLKMRSSSYYLAALAIADFAFLLAIFVVTFLENLYNSHGWCQLIIYISAVASTLSTWLIVAFTVERFIAIQYPLRRPQMCTVSRAKTVILVLAFIATSTHSYVFWTSGVLPRGGILECEILPEYYAVMKIVNFIDTIYSLILPFLLIIVMNVMIARNIYHFSKRITSGTFQESLSQSRCEESTSSSNRSRLQSSSQKSTIVKSSNQIGKDIEQHLSSIHLKSSNIMSPKIQHGISKMLLLVSSVYILLNLPSYAIRLYGFFVDAILNEELPPSLWCVQQFCMIFFYTNFSVNFTLYSMYGVTFRRCLFQLIRNATKKLRPKQNSFNMGDLKKNRRA